MFTGCETNRVTPSIAATEQNINSANQQKLIKNIPTVSLDNSLERENINRRLTLLNDRDKVFYVYLLSYGKVVSFYVAKGKVSSVNSFNTPSERIVRDENCAQDQNERNYNGKDVAGCYFSVEAPDQDGTYGSNGDGVFFFTTDGAYVEWNDQYLVSDYPLKITTPELPILVTK